jgi:hypothetical protein
VLDSLITSKTRIRLLVKFFSNPDTRAYLREIAEEFGESTNSVRVELNRLSDAKLLISAPEGRTVKYSANTRHPLFGNITQIVTKYLGLDEIALNIVERLGNVDRAFVIGDYARGLDSGIIDLVIVGEDIDRALLDKLSGKVESIINRKIRSLVLSPAEFQNLLQKPGNRFEHPILLYGDV